MAGNVRLLRDPSSTTSKSVEFFKQFQYDLGTVRTAQCSKEGGGYLRVKGDRAEMELTGCTCGYGGEGPRGTASVLQMLGLSQREAECLMQQKSFDINFECKRK